MHVVVSPGQVGRAVARWYQGDAEPAPDGSGRTSMNGAAEGTNVRRSAMWLAALRPTGAAALHPSRRYRPVMNGRAPSDLRDLVERLTALAERRLQTAPAQRGGAGPGAPAGRSPARPRPRPGGLAGCAAGRAPGRADGRRQEHDLQHHRRSRPPARPGCSRPTTRVAVVLVHPDDHAAVAEGCPGRRAGRPAPLRRRRHHRARAGARRRARHRFGGARQPGAGRSPRGGRRPVLLRDHRHALRRPGAVGRAGPCPGTRPAAARSSSTGCRPTPRTGRTSWPTSGGCSPRPGSRDLLGSRAGRPAARPGGHRGRRPGSRRRPPGAGHHRPGHGRDRAPAGRPRGPDRAGHPGPDRLAGRAGRDPGPRRRRRRPRGHRCRGPAPGRRAVVRGGPGGPAPGARRRARSCARRRCGAGSRSSGRTR